MASPIFWTRGIDGARSQGPPHGGAAMGEAPSSPLLETDVLEARAQGRAARRPQGGKIMVAAREMPAMASAMYSSSNLDMGDFSTFVDSHSSSALQQHDQLRQARHPDRRMLLGGA